MISPTARQSYSLLFITLATISNSFNMNMVINSPYGRRAPTFRSAKPTLTTEFSSGLISTLAIGALKRRLKDNTKVECNVNVDTNELMRGKVGPVTVKGRKWMSPLGLSCRSIEAIVDQCSLDMASMIQNRKLHLNVPARGSAMVALDAVDFGRFLSYPLLETPSFRHNDVDHNIELLKDKISIEPEHNTVVFHIELLQGIWRCELQRAPNGAKIQVSFVEGIGDLSIGEISLLEKGLSKTMSSFFNELVINLDGSFIHFKDMMVTSNSKFPFVILSLELMVKKFPSRSIKF